MPVVTAVILYRYLQATSSVAVMHSLPFTRNHLLIAISYRELYLLYPYCYKKIILMLISKPAYKQWGYGDDITIDTVNVFTEARY